MADEIKQEEKEVVVPVADVEATVEEVAAVVPEVAVEAAGADRGRRPSRGGRRGGKKPERGGRTKPEFDNKILAIRRVARVVAGGRRFNFSVALVAGDKKGKVGVGLGKAGDTALAIDKALRDAKKHMIVINTTKEMSIPHESYAKYSSAKVSISPSKDRGLVAGSAARTVLELAGVSNVVAKIISPSKNKLNIARATIDALKGLDLVKPPRVSAK